MEWLAKMHEAGLHVIIASARPAKLTWSWLKLHAPGLEQVVHVSATRPDADVYLDASAIPFDGKHWPELAELQDFSPWWQRDSE